MKHLRLSIVVLVFTLTINSLQAQEKIELENSVLCKVELFEVGATRLTNDYYVKHLLIQKGYIVTPVII